MDVMKGLIFALTVLLLGGVALAGEPAGPSDEEGMVLVEGGCFNMGCGIWVGKCRPDEVPEHDVCLDDFYMDAYEVTQSAYWREMTANPSFYLGDNLPVAGVTWYEARDYCSKIGKRLPTEAEWEYAARGGGKMDSWAGTNFKAEVWDYAWYSRYAGGGGGQPHPVGQKLDNGLGLYDMTGNVWEWVSDRYSTDYYGKSPEKNPRGSSIGELRVLRGGSWYYRSSVVRTTYRYGVRPDTRSDDFGFRCARSR
jgi:formylglycine-generating enzyme required for sulfatase activity